MENLNFLNHANRNQLIQIMINNGISFEFDSPNSVYIEKIKNKFHLKNKNFLINFLKKLNFSQIITIILEILLFISFIFLLILFYFFFFPSINKFCSNNINENCIRCPIFSTCINGSVYCNDGFILIHHYCIPNTENKIILSKLIDLTYNLLSKISGDYHCLIKSIDYITKTNLEIFLLNELNNLNIYSNYLIEETLNYLNNDSLIIKKNLNENEIFTFQIIQRSLKCKIKLYLINHFKYIFIFTFLILIIFLILFKKYYILNNKKKNQLIIRSLINFIQNNNNFITEPQFISFLSKFNKNPEENLYYLILKEIKLYPEIQIIKLGNNISLKLN